MTTSSKTPVLTVGEVAPLSFSIIATFLLLVPEGPEFSYAEVIGVAASVLAFAVFVPQAVRVWRARNDHHALLGVSVVTNMFIVNNSLVWGLYAASIGEFFVGAAGIINLPLATMIIAVIVRSRLIQRDHLADDMAFQSRASGGHAEMSRNPSSAP